jgi:hypothetical protein
MKLESLGVLGYLGGDLFTASMFPKWFINLARTGLLPLAPSISPSSLGLCITLTESLFLKFCALGYSPTVKKLPAPAAVVTANDFYLMLSFMFF